MFQSKNYPIRHSQNNILFKSLYFHLMSSPTPKNARALPSSSRVKSKQSDIIHEWRRGFQGRLDRLCQLWDLFWERKQYPGADAYALKLHKGILSDLED